MSYAYIYEYSFLSRRMREKKTMSSSFEKEASGGGETSSASKEVPGGVQRSSALFADSQSQISVSEISLVNTNTTSKDISSFEDSFKNVRGGLRRSLAKRDVTKLEIEDEDDEDIWGEDAIEDPVGDLITKMLNEGKVPYFGYSSPPLHPPTEPQPVEDDFKLSPLLSLRNYRALRRFILAAWNGDNSQRSALFGQQGNMKCDGRQSMRFLLESCAVCYVAIYSLNDIVIRSVAKGILLIVIWAVSTILFDTEEVESLISFMTPTWVIHAIERCNAAAREVFGIVEQEFLWGHQFQGRTLLWSDKECLFKFRRRHRRLITIKNERRHNRKEIKEGKAERRRRAKRGESLTPLELDKMEKLTNSYEQLDSAVNQLTLEPPTFFPDNVNNEGTSDLSSQSVGDATKRHMESLEYCRKMIFIDKRERDMLKPVEIMATAHGNKASTTTSPRSSGGEAIEIVDQFPDIGQVDDINSANRHECLDQISVSTTFSDSNSVSFDQGSDYSTEEEDDDDDEASLGTYASESTESTTRDMTWMVVGAKIGHKILNAKKLRRVIANPDAAQQLIPQEAKNFIDGMNKDESPHDTLYPKSHSWEGRPTSGDMSPTSPSLHQSQSTELDIKRPVHGMWTSAGSAAKTLTLPASPRIGGRLPAIDDPKPGVRNGTPPRWPLNGLTSPPTSPSTIATPQKSNLSARKAFNFTTDTEDHTTRLEPIGKGVKMVVPLSPPNSQTNAIITSGPCFYQMGTVMSSQRIYIPLNENSETSHHYHITGRRKTNCLAIKVILDKALLRGSRFAEMNLRIMDEWNYVPRHSKYPLGACVATTFGVGVLVGWRVEDDMHIVRSLWNRSGPGSGLAYLRRDCLHSVIEAAVGFDVQTTYGAGEVVAYVKGGKKNMTGKYLVSLNGRVREFNRCQILSCPGATFVPVTEHIRAAALYRLEVIRYKAKRREQMLNSPLKGVRPKGMWRNFSEYVDLFANSFSVAIAEDPDFDDEFDKFLTNIINLLDGNNGPGDEESSLLDDSKASNESISIDQSKSLDASEANAAVGWNINDLFKCFFDDSKGGEEEIIGESKEVSLQAQAFEEAHFSAEVLIRVLLRTITVAKTSVKDRPKLQIALAMVHEGLLFVRQVLRVQKKHTSRKVMKAWFHALNEISETFGPLKERAAALGVQIAKRLRKQGSIAKRRLLRFFDCALGDTQLLQALELGDWKKAIFRVEVAIVKAEITDASTCEQLHRGAIMMYKNLAPRKKDRKSQAAASRNVNKMINFAKLMKIIASPGRSIMRLLTYDDVLSLFDRVLVRVFEKDPLCSTVINIYAFNFDSVRHLRTLNNMPIAGKLWTTVLDAIDEELTFATSEVPEQTKYFLEPFVKLFSLGVAQFHLSQRGGSFADWLDFLMEEDAVKIIQDLDMKFIDSLETLCNDIKQVVQVLPYIKTIDNDILELIDEFSFDLFLKEITDVIGDPEKSVAYMTERASVLVERFLDYLPRMSIPIERRELQDGWVLTCRSKDGGDLRLNDLSVLRENLFLSVLGSDNVFHPLSGKYYIGSPRNSPISVSSDLNDDNSQEDSVLDEVRDLILSAQAHGHWIAGVGGLREAHHFISNGMPPQLTGLPMSDKLKTQIDLWQTSAIPDFELLETAIREVSHIIQLQSEEEIRIEVPQQPTQQPTKCFDPKLDPTVLFLDIKNLTLRLEEFGFRVEKGEPLTVFDPVFEGCGSITVKNVSITLKVEVKKERVFRDGRLTPRPVLQLAKFEVELEELNLEFMETGADWLLNTVLKGFSHQITEVVQENLKEQIVQQVHTVLEQVNGFIDANPDMLISILGVTLKDLEENIVCV